MRMIDLSSFNLKHASYAPKDMNCHQISLNICLDKIILLSQFFFYIPLFFSSIHLSAPCIMMDTIDLSLPKE